MAKEQYKVYVTRNIPEPGMSLLQEHFDVKVNRHDRPVTRSELLKEVKDVDALLCLYTDAIDKEIIEKGAKLKVISSYAVGYDNIDVSLATKKGIFVTNTPGVLTETTADLAWALLMAVARKIVAGDCYIRAGKFKVWNPMMFLGRSFQGKRLGIIGLGNIGQAVARRAKGFGLEICYFDVTRKQEAEDTLGVKYLPFDEIIATSDFITLHLPLSSANRHLFGKEEFRRMKNGAIFINTSRGPLVDEEALYRALKEKEIAGAGLDVYEHEPQVTPGLLDLDEVVLLPHIGSCTQETRAQMAELAAKNIIGALKGEKIPHLVNVELAND